MIICGDDGYAAAVLADLAADDIATIAVLRANALGDFVFSLPALAALRQRFPSASITVWGRPWLVDLLRDRPSPVDRVRPLPDVPGVSVSAGSAGGADLPRWLERERAEHYDLGIQLHGGGRHSNALLREIGPRLTLGMRSPDAADLDVTLPYVYQQHDVVRCLEVVGLLGAVAEPVPHLAVTSHDTTLARVALRMESGQAYAVLHAGASDPRRRWPPDRFARVADALTRSGRSVVLTGTAEERAVSAQVVAAAASDLLDLTGALSLPALVGVLAAADVVVANDTGPLHLADAVGTPSVGIYWVVNALNGGPLTRARHRPVIGWTRTCPRCGVDLVPTATAANSRRCDHDDPVVGDVSVDDVLHELEELLDVTSSSRRGSLPAFASDQRG